METPTPVYLTVDLFFRPGEASTDWALWVCLQPHVRRAQLAGWVEESGGRESAYQLVPRPVQGVEREDFVPVCFRDGDDVSLALSSLDGTVSIERGNAGRHDLIVADGEAIAVRNRPPHQAGPEPTRIQQLPTGVSFAKAYTQALRQAQAGSADDEPVTARELETMLKLALWGGARRVIPDAGIPGLRDGDPHQAVGIMHLGDEDGAFVTNLHSLLGLMFPIGTARDLDRLRKLAELSVRVEGQAEPIVVRDYQPWFARLPDALPAARDRVSLTWDAGYADRVYLQDIGTAFPRIGASGSRDYGRLRTHRAGPQPPAATDDEPHRLSEVRAGVVLLQGEIEVPDPQPDLTFALYDTYEATVRPFRRLPATEGTPCLQQLTPAPHDAQRLMAALAADKGLLKQAIVSDVEGTERDFDCLEVSGERILVFGDRVEGGAITIRAADPTGATLTAKWQTQDRTNRSGLGAHWKFEQPALPKAPVDFDLLRCTSGLAPGEAWPDETLLDALVPVLFFRADLAFQPAHAVDSIEGTVQVRYPAGDSGFEPPVDESGLAKLDDPIAEFDDDLINHNALNVYTTWGPGHAEVHHSPWAENYPVASHKPTEPDGERVHRFVYRYPFAVDAPHRDDDAAPDPDAWQFYADLYARMATPRRLRFEVEHTYGTRIDFGEGDATISARASFPPALPTRVTRRPDAGGGETEAFITVTLAPDRAPGPSDDLDDARFNDYAELRFETRWLDVPPPVAADDEDDAVTKSAWARHHAAWRCVAELNHARACTLHLRLLRYDVREALARGSRLTLADALKDVSDRIESRIDITDALHEWSSRWLNGPGSGRPGPIRVPLTRARPRIFELCNLVEFELELERSDALVPAVDRDWVLLRPLAELEQDSHAQKMDKVALIEGDRPTPEGAAFSAWLQSLRARRDPVRAAPPESQDRQAFVEALQQFLGSGRRALPGSWIVPRGQQQVSAGGVTPSVCPVAFRPLRPHRQLGDDTFACVAAYLRTLDAVLAAYVPQWTDRGREHWQDKWLAPLAAGNDSAVAIERLVTALADTAWPTPAASSRVEPFAARLRTAFPARPGPGAPAGSADEASRAARSFRDWLEKRLRQSPSLYASAKAFLVTEVAAGEDGAGLSEYFRMRSVKFIRNDFQGEPVIDRDLFTVRQALAHSDAQRLYQAEVLEDALYDNRFHFERFALETFESALEEQRPESQEPGLLDRQRLPIIDSRLLLPAGAQALDGTGASMAPRLPVALASRETLKPPQHEWTGMLAALQDQPAIPQPLAEKAFMRGALAAWESPEQGRALRVIGAGVESGAGTRQTASIHFPRSGNLDDFVLSSVFRIDADEEGSFTNDAFHLRIGTGDAPDLAPAAAAPVGERLDEKTLRLLQTLKAEPQIEALSDAALADVTDPTVIEDIRKLIAPIEPLDLASRSRDEALSFRIDPDESGGDLLEVRIEIDAQASIRPRAVEVLVLRSEDGADRREPGVWVMINLELPVWNRWLVSLRQERNAPDEEAAAHAFALQFGQTSQAVRDASPYQPVVVEPLAAEDHALAEALDLSARLDAERGIDIVALMAAVLEETGLVQGGGAAGARPWLDFDLSLTVSQRQLAHLPAVYVDESGDLVEDFAQGLRVQDSAFPLRNYRWAVAALHDADQRPEPVRFDPGYDDFVLEFQWFSATNLPFLRIRRVDVRVLE